MTRHLKFAYPNFWVKRYEKHTKT